MLAKASRRRPRPGGRHRARRPGPSRGQSPCSQRARSVRRRSGCPPSTARSALRPFPLTLTMVVTPSRKVAQNTSSVSLRSRRREVRRTRGTTRSARSTTRQARPTRRWPVRLPLFADADQGRRPCHRRAGTRPRRFCPVVTMSRATLVNADVGQSVRITISPTSRPCRRQSVAPDAHQRWWCPRSSRAGTRRSPRCRRRRRDLFALLTKADSDHRTSSSPAWKNERPVPLDESPPDGRCSFTVVVAGLEVAHEHLLAVAVVADEILGGRFRGTRPAAVRADRQRSRDAPIPLPYRPVPR